MVHGCCRERHAGIGNPEHHHHSPRRRRTVRGKSWFHLQPVCSMVEPIINWLDRILFGRAWIYPIIWDDANDTLRELGPQTILLQHMGVERRGHLQIEDMGPAIRGLRMEHFELHHGIILQCGVFVRLLEYEGMMDSWPRLTATNERQNVVLQWHRENDDARIASRQCPVCLGDYGDVHVPTIIIVEQEVDPSESVVPLSRCPLNPLSVRSSC
ncbi:hypothetical protein CAEBREN_18249 [Caenorhabditis brenneri]|uniref:Uncharacterized protein n=1 Tax=Caenorhabditis brenneri TaxID=135651 RepID=G0NDB6_CAEBE|nr:hypothetical protein CAEBREN_18249 [Caenorhabditis brenneri]